MNIFNNQRDKINADTDLYCIFGKPVRHSLSPAMQNAAFMECGINALYTAFEIEDIKSGIRAMKALNIRGASITIPFKNEAMKYIDEIDPAAEEIKAVNTIINNNGRITGYNTDGAGAVQSLADNRIKIRDSNILLIGNGGAAKAIVYALLHEGAVVSIAGRNMNKILSFIRSIKYKDTINHMLIKDISNDYMRNIDIIINATPVGMRPDINNSPIDESLIQNKHVVFDIVYSPDITRLLKTAKKKGCRIIRGMEMLINQGAAQFEIWTGRKAPLSVMKKTVIKFLK